MKKFAVCVGCGCLVPTDGAYTVAPYELIVVCASCEEERVEEEEREHEEREAWEVQRSAYLWD